MSKQGQEKQLDEGIEVQELNEPIVESAIFPWKKYTKELDIFLDEKAKECSLSVDSEEINLMKKYLIAWLNVRLMESPNYPKVLIEMGLKLHANNFIVSKFSEAKIAELQERVRTLLEQKGY